FWDGRQATCAFEITPEADEEGNVPDLDNELFTINELAIGNDRHGYLLAARDDGALVTYNIRRRRHEMTSDTVAYSARCLELVKSGSKVLLGTDEGVVNVFNWNEFGNICDRFPVRLARAEKASKTAQGLDRPSVESIVKINEDIVAVATDDGLLFVSRVYDSTLCCCSAVSILPNRILEALGQHYCEEVTNGDCKAPSTGILASGGGDCMTLAASPDGQILASGLPHLAKIRFFPTQHLPALLEQEEEQLNMPRRQRELPMKKKTSQAKRQRIITDVKDQQLRQDFLSGLYGSQQEADHDSDSSSTDDE
ncbi:WD domain repeat-containing protein 55, partial [Cichlidogyrus casuarinus]